MKSLDQRRVGGTSSHVSIILLSPSTAPADRVGGPSPPRRTGQRVRHITSAFDGEPANVPPWTLSMGTDSATAPEVLKGGPTSATVDPTT